MIWRTLTLRNNLGQKSRGNGAYQIVARQKCYRKDTDRLDFTRVYEGFWGLHTRAIGKNHELRHFTLRKNLAKKSKYTSTYQIVARQKCYRMDTDRLKCTRV
jgi:hypothetical protein